MPNHDNRPVCVPTAEAAFERCRQHLFQQLDTIRLALCALNLDAPNEAQLALLKLIDDRLKRLGADLKACQASRP